MAFAIPLGILAFLVVMFLIAPWLIALGVVGVVILLVFGIALGLRLRRDTSRTIHESALTAQPTTQPDPAETDLLGAHHPGAAGPRDDAQG